VISCDNINMALQLNVEISYAERDMNTNSISKASKYFKSNVEQGGLEEKFNESQQKQLNSILSDLIKQNIDKKNTKPASTQIFKKVTIINPFSINSKNIQICGKNLIEITVCLTRI
jgi:hypothetical protein